MEVPSWDRMRTTPQSRPLLQDPVPPSIPKRSDRLVLRGGRRLLLSQNVIINLRGWVFTVHRKGECRLNGLVIPGRLNVFVLVTPEETNPPFFLILCVRDFSR